MVNRRMEFFIGMTVVVIFVAVAIMTILFGPQQGVFVRGGGKKMTIVFEKANGITNNSKVMKSGIEIGRVYKRELVDDGSKLEVRVIFELNPDAKIFSNEFARINRNLIGDAAIEFVKNPKYRGKISEFNTKDIIYGAPGGDLMGTVSSIEGDLAKAIQEVTKAAGGLTLFMDNLNLFLGSPDELRTKRDRLQATFTELNATLASIKNLANNMNGVISNPEMQADLRKGISAIPDIISKADKLMSNANTLTNDFHSTLQRSHRTFDQVEKNLDNLQDFTAALSERGPEFIGSLSDSAKDMKTMVNSISELANDLVLQINDPQTPFGMMADKEIASSLRGIIRNSEQITQKLQPIMDDAQVFTNKIAHRPSSLIWGGTNYKGVSTAQTKDYGLQPFSPGGGVSSTLYRPSSRNSEKTEPLEYVPGAATDLMDPDSLNAYYSKYPTKTRDSLSKGNSGCFLGGLFKGNKQNGPEPDWGTYYGNAPVMEKSYPEMDPITLPKLNEKSAKPKKDRSKMTFAFGKKSKGNPSSAAPISYADPAPSQAYTQYPSSYPYNNMMDSNSIPYSEQAQGNVLPQLGAQPGSDNDNMGTSTSVQRIPLTRSESSTEILPTTINRPRQRTQSAFADDGLPMEVIPSN